MALTPIDFPFGMGIAGTEAGRVRADLARQQSLAADAPAYTVVANNERASSLVGVHPSPQALEYHRESIRQQIEAERQRNMAEAAAARLWDTPLRYDQLSGNQYRSSNPQGTAKMMNPLEYDEAKRGAERTELMEVKCGVSGHVKTLRAELQAKTDDWLDGTPKPRKISVRTGWKI